MPVIGSVDLIDFPDLSLHNIPCKIDTGAMSSSIHCHRVRIKEVDGKDMLLVRFLDPKNPQHIKKDFVFEHFSEKRIKNSFGDAEYRYMVKLKVTLMGQTFETEFSLANRKEMNYRVLLGRKLLRKRFLVDVSKKNVSYKNKLIIHGNSNSIA